MPNAPAGIGAIDIPGIQAHSAQGTWLQMEKIFGQGITTGEFDTISRLRNIKGPNFSVKDQDVTSHDSELGIMQYEPGLIDLGELTADQFYLPESLVQAAFEAHAYNRDIVYFRLLMRSKGVTLAYRTGYAYVKTMGDSYPSDGGMMQRNISIRLTGQWPLATGDPGT
jgi:hypothetical protein